MAAVQGRVAARSGARPFWTERRRESLAFLLFILPNMTMLTIWTFYPFFSSLYLSVTNWNLLQPVKRFVGLSNYASLMRSEIFWKVVSNTVVFTVGTVFIKLGLALALAVLLNQWLAGRAVWRAIIFSPHVTTSAAMALVWLSMYDPNHGPLAALFSFLGLSFPNVMASTSLALPAIMVVAIWQGLGYSTVIFLAALQGVNRDLKDAAAVDGANSWQAFWHVSFPAISPVTYFLVVTSLISAFQTFDLIQVMSKGGPVNSTSLYVFYLYEEAFSYYRMGHASAVAVIFFTIIMAITYLQTQIAQRWVHYS